MISKDVLEHVDEASLKILLARALKCVKRAFIVVPLSSTRRAESYIIPEYDKDVTHILREPFEWWVEVFEKAGWTVDQAAYQFPGCKENWTATWPEGNGFFILSSKA